MTRDVVTVSTTTPVKNVAELMLTRGVSAVPVINAQGRVAGIISEADLLFRESSAPSTPSWFATKRSEQRRRRREALTAADLMTVPVISVHPETTLTQAATLMYEKRIKRLPVMDGESLKGIISRADVLGLFLVPDDLLRRRARRALQLTLGRDSSAHVHVDVRNGVLSLTGEVLAHTDADFVARVLGGMDGVLAVENNLKWRVDDRLLAEYEQLTRV
jgi:CBS domain-containing protein